MSNFELVPQLVGWTNDLQIISWNIQTGKIEKMQPMSQGNLITAIFSPNNVLATINAENDSISLWTRAEKPLYPSILSGHVAPVTSVSFHPNQPILLSGSRDGTFKIWKLEGEILASYSNQGNVFDLSFDHDGKYVVISNETGIDVWGIK